MPQNKFCTIFQISRSQEKSYNASSSKESTLNYLKKVRDKFDIIVFCMSSWQEWYKKGIVNRNYHILNNLLKKPSIDKVLAIDFLPYTKKRALRSYFENQLFSVGGKILKKDFTSTLRQLADNFFIYSTIDSVFSEARLYRKLKKIISLLSFRNIILWSYFPMFVGYFDNINSRLKVFDAVDNWIEHPNFKDYRKRLQKNYNFIGQKADVIFTVSKKLARLFPNNKNVHWVPNGVDVKHFSSSKPKTSSQAKSRDQNSKLAGIPRPIIGYVGIIQSRVDMDLIKYLATQNPDKSVVLVGMVWPDAKIDIIRGLKNVYLLGHKPYQELPQFINQFDVCIIPHKINEFTYSMNPLKLYEYLACGKPVVTTPVAGIEEFKDLVRVASSKEEFNQQIKKALAENSIKEHACRVKAAQKHSWQSRLNRMLKIIFEKI